MCLTNRFRPLVENVLRRAPILCSDGILISDFWACVVLCFHVISLCEPANHRCSIGIGKTVKSVLLDRQSPFGDALIPFNLSICSSLFFNKKLYRLPPSSPWLKELIVVYFAGYAAAGSGSRVRLLLQGAQHSQDVDFTRSIGVDELLESMLRLPRQSCFVLAVMDCGPSGSISNLDLMSRSCVYVIIIQIYRLNA